MNVSPTEPMLGGPVHADGRHLLRDTTLQQDETKREEHGKDLVFVELAERAERMISALGREFSIGALIPALRSLRKKALYL
jgi:hypothetical protein